MSVETHQIPTYPPVRVTDYRALARKKLPRQFFDFIDGGGYSEITLNQNHTDFNRIKFNKRILRDGSNPDTATEVLGQKLAQPLILAPVGFAGVYARRGEILAAKAAAKAGVPFCMSTLSICPIEEVRQDTQAPFWFQLYMINDKGYCKELLQRAHEAGCPVLIYTVDLPVVGIRYKDIRNRLAGNGASLVTKLSTLWQFVSHPGWLFDVAMKGKPLTLGNFTALVPPTIQNFTKIREWVQGEINQGMTWKDLEWVLSNWPGKVVVKGVLDTEDARQCTSMGAHGIVVSNHAGRHLDSTPSTISVLPKIADAVGDKVEILIDGGVFSGIEVVKALALGAKACMIGRPWAYALAADGEKGVSEILRIMHRELVVAMSHLGVNSIDKIDRSLVNGYENF